MQNFGGISRYFFELMNNASSAGFEYDLSLLLSSNEYLFESTKISSAIKIPNKFAKNFYRLSNQLNLQYSQLQINYADYDILHPTFYEDYFVQKIKNPYVLTVHDLINEKFPQYFQNNNKLVKQKQNLIENASRIIAVSENTKKDIIEHFKINESKIDVIYLAESLSSIKSLKVEKLPPRYLLFIGKRGGYKNFENMYEGVKNLLKKESDLFLVCAGGGEFSLTEKGQFLRDELSHKINYFSFTKNEELKYLYENAVCFIFPSLYEGFGIPVLESFASGCVLCVSYSSSLKEIGGSAALYFDPNSPEEIKNAVEHALSLDKKNAYIEEGFQELKKYTWRKTTEHTFNTYKKC